MGNWKVIEPEATINRVLNPVAGATGNFAAVGGGTMTRSTTQSKWGLRSFNIVTAANDQGGSLTLDTLANAKHYVTMFVRGTLPTSWDWSLDDSTYNVPAVVLQIDDDWAVYGFDFPAAQANGSTTLYIRQNGAGAGNFFIDGIQVEEKDGYWTTHCDGDREGCEWLGLAHASISQRSALSRAGGRLRDLKDDFDFGVATAIGVGATQQALTVNQYATQPGGELAEIKGLSRTFSLVGPLYNRDGSGCDLHEVRENLLRLLKKDSYPKDQDGWQPVRIWYTGDAIVKEIKAHYQSGLGANIGVNNLIHERIPLQFSAPGPDFKEIGESSQLLDVEDSATFYLVAGRLRSSGQWDNMGPASVAPTPVASVSAMVVGPDKRIYFGGSFDNFDNQGAGDHIMIYDPQTDAYSTLGGGLNGTVVGLLFIGQELYACGFFTNAGGDAAADYIAKIDPFAGTPTWANVGGGPGAGTVTSVQDMHVAQNNKLYVVGDFLNWQGIANADGIVALDLNAGTWSAVGTGTSATINAATSRGTDLYVTGLFTTIGGVSANRVAVADIETDTWAALGPGVNATGRDVCIFNNGDLALVGDFTLTGDSVTTLRRAARWNGTAWSELGEGLNAAARKCIVASDDLLIVVGEYSEAGGIPADRLAGFNGSVWVPLDINLPTRVSITDAVAVGDPSPLEDSLYDLWAGFNRTGSGSDTGYYGGIATANNEGSARAYPRIFIERSGGTGEVRVRSVRNETLGLSIYLGYKILDGELLEFDLAPTQKSAISSIAGAIGDAVLPGSDFGEFHLMPGNNIVSCFVDDVGAGGSTRSAWMIWQDTFDGID